MPRLVPCFGSSPCLAVARTALATPTFVLKPSPLRNSSVRGRLLGSAGSICLSLTGTSSAFEHRQSL
ncbi:hypothetical protein [Sporisorium scitamineum]|uniref:Uncharacterized protein n=1 Tax=Sporisorium scitamineum TaxID=49012 RepID=A0A0F7RZH3_9BASI|nr:hypothetical protein [Sporisorium scitamineum]